MVFIYATIGTAVFRLITPGIGFPFIPFMDFVVSYHIGPDRKVFPAPRPITSIGLFASMDMHVGFQTRRPIEDFVAQGADTILLYRF